MAAYAATVASDLRKGLKVDHNVGVGMYYGTVDITNYNTTLVALTDITGKFKQIHSVITDTTDNGYQLKWDDTGNAFKAYNVGVTEDGTVLTTQTTATGAILDDDSAASNGLVVYLHVDEVTEAGLYSGHLESVTAGNADSQFEIGASGPVILVTDDDAAATAGLQLYFDEDAASADSRWLVNNTITGEDVFILATDGKAIRVAHDASAGTTGVAIYFDDDAANVHERLLFISPTDTAGAYDTDDIVGSGATESAFTGTATETALVEVDDDTDVGLANFVAYGLV